MKLISHRGNIDGKTLLENQPSYIDDAIELGYDVEVDIWYIGDRVYLGHDLAQYQIDIHWLENRKSKLWIHCKNLNSLSVFSMYEAPFKYFWHQNDEYALTSNFYTISYPGKEPHKKTIMAMPESVDIYYDKNKKRLTEKGKKSLTTAYGVLTDIPLFFNTIRNEL